MPSTLHAGPVGLTQRGSWGEKLLLTAWSLQCSVSCGAGIRRRRVTCRGDEGSLLHASACSFKDQPPLTEPCVHDDCPRLSDQAWHVGAWSLVSTCPNTCRPILVPWSLVVAAHMPFLGSDMQYRALSLPPSSLPHSLLPFFVGTLKSSLPAPGARSLGVCPLYIHGVLSSHPMGPSAPRAAARAPGDGRWHVPLGHPATAGACSCGSLQRWSPVTRSPALFLRVRTRVEAGQTSAPPHT